ncbi:hypothetical protein GDO78_001034 [Eleutherodactylus coqui]|uniref:Thyroid hormone receptor associated protein 3 n=1 Tax=Eleutherodactylus coqui TaxID=57060 RepID=A0A8J6FQU1_ELECQ|nr:hypothetical protein GDO78_001034 [Eleutherodactylus coqui]
MSKNKSKSRSGSSRSISRSRSRSFSKSRSRSRSLSHSRKRRHSSRSRSRSYSPGYNRERNHPRVYQNRDFRGHNRGYRRPYYFRGRGRGFYPRGQHNRGGYVNYRPNWQNYNRQPYSPRRARSRSRSPKRRSVSPRSRSHSRNSDKSSSDRSRRSSSSRSSSNHSRVETKRKSKKDKKSHSKDQRSSAQATDDDSKEQSASGGADPSSKEGNKAWQDMETYDESPAPQHSPSERTPTLKSSVQSVVVRRCSPRPSPAQKPSPPSPTVLQSSATFRVSSRQSPFEHSLSPPRKSPLTKSPPSMSSLYGNSQKEEGRSGELTAPVGTGYKRPSGVMAHERKLSRDLVHSNKKDQEFKSIFQHIQSAQPQRSPSELFAQHIVTIVHHVKEHHFGPSTMTLSERFSSYLKKTKEQEPSKTRKSPEIHRRIDISPSAFRKHGILHEEAKPTKEGSHKGEGKYREEPSDLRQDIERRKKHKDKRDHSRDSGDSRDSSRSRERSPEKPEKPRKSSKKHKKHRKVRERSRSSSSSSHSSHSMRAAGTDEFPPEHEDRDENSSNFEKARLGNKDYQGSSDRGRARGTFVRW